MTTPLSRRRFNQGLAASALLGPTILSRVARSAASDRINIGFIGVGTQGRGHVNRLVGQADVQVVAICDVVVERANAAKEIVEKRYADAAKSGQYKGCATYNDFRELLARKDIDAVVIATPDHWHAIPVLEACRAGKDIYCEKPLSLTVLEAKAMIDAVRKYNRVFQTGSQQRSSPEFRLACELVRSGRIGKVEKVYVNVGAPSLP